MALLQLFEALDFVITLITFFMIYSRIFYPELIANKIVSLLMTIVIMFVLIIPFPIVKYLVFLGLFCYGFFMGFRPWEWGLTDPAEHDEGLMIGGQGQPYDPYIHDL
jgi:hypothetical protein